ncbi:uncharacterized protein EI97DRAFT_460007 [Westerdykella ornata]|uniref:Uncharacterized protein n=1 Tax=Westerdykella ornata TaxID=318751 RepID=A0A6A6JEL3_WESOR|nr:uncharacterized protein EI97DRAFT_460007 [Westerdykella ornata]KAF2274737.1 hypothetical protein EI97DRAFT_460007 [Westerdykella ornata]
MYARSLLLAAAACVVPAVQGDFYIVTEFPVPTSLIPSFSNSEDAKSWTSSVVFNAEISYSRLTAALGPTHASSASSIASLVSEFVVTATSNYSIPAKVTEPDQTERIIGKPAWYTALPSEVRSWKEREWETMKSVASGVVAARLTTTRSKGAAPVQTAVPGLGGVGWAVAGAAAAAFF